MKSSIYEFDPNGDVVLLLSTDRASFCWSKDTLWLQELPPGVSADDIYNENAAAEDGPTTGGDDFPLPEDGDLQDAGPEDVRLTSESYRMKVSSRHLMLSSPVFRSMLTGSWVESQEDGSGNRQIKTEGWDRDAMVIFLDILHSHDRAVPRSVDLETLAKFAVIVDYYQCHEPVEIFADLWIEKLRKTLPSIYGKQSTLWLLISLVFPRIDIFHTMARLTVRHCQHPLRAVDLPIPEDVLDEIDRKRQECTSEIFSTLYNLIESLGDRSECSYECSAILLGSLTKEMKKNGILNPPITSPYNGFSVTAVNAMVQNFKSPAWSVHSFTRYPDRHPCTIQTKLNPAIKRIERDLETWKPVEHGIRVD